VKTVLVFAGTSEGRMLVERLVGMHVRCVACVATEYGSALLPAYESVAVLQGRMVAAQMRDVILRENTQLVIDATHPYAVEASRNIGQACAEAGVELWRLVRERADMAVDADLEYYPDVAGIVRRLNELQGNVLLTTGSKNLSAFTGVKDYAQRLYPRVLPICSSLEACGRLGYDMRNIIAMQGPFSQALNEAMLKEFNIRVLVTKESGQAGGFLEKLAAAKNCGVLTLVLGRPVSENGFTMAQIERALLDRFQTEGQDA
jgi:precorrin-6x reductase